MVPAQAGRGVRKGPPCAHPWRQRPERSSLRASTPPERPSPRASMAAELLLPALDPAARSSGGFGDRNELLLSLHTRSDQQSTEAPARPRVEVQRGQAAAGAAQRNHDDEARSKGCASLIGIYIYKGIFVNAHSH